MYDFKSKSILVRSDFKSKSKITKLILNHDFKSNAFKSFPTLGIMEIIPRKDLTNPSMSVQDHFVRPEK